MELQSRPRTILSDEEIIALYWDRDEQAISRTDEKYKKFLLSVAFNIVFDDQDCEECLNDTYIDAWNSMPPSKPALLQAFLATIMRRTAIDRYKSRKRQKRIASELTVSLSELEEIIADESDSSAETDELARLLSDFVRSLPDRRMYIFMSRYYFARPIGEIASLLGCSESTVNKEIAAIKRELQEKLMKEGYTL
ncbi:MAG: RNA polymerase sigma factor [Clostridia bacterium]|nr:RNA polymerase sigma factor [Clostridia bacterium]